MKPPVKIYSRILTAALFTAVAAACSDDSFLTDGPSSGKTVTITAQCADMIEPFSMPETMTRANEPKTEAEKKINTLHIFFFNSEGNFVESTYDNFKPYVTQKNFMFVVKEDAYKELTGITIVALANINGCDDENGNKFLTAWSEDGKIPTGDRNGEPYRIKDLQDLKDWVYAPKLRTDEGTDITQLPKAGMPMIGILENVSLNQTSGNLIIPMKALMARVDINVTLNPNQESIDGRFPQITIKEFGVMNMPSTVPFSMPDTLKMNDTDVTKLEKEVKVTLEKPLTINKNTTGQIPFTYYTYENIQYPDKDAQRPGGGYAYVDGKLTFPEGVDKPEEKQRWKPTIAKKERTSALVLRGTYITHQELVYDAEFKIFLGQNPIDDFKVKRNYKYTNNITIKGLDYVRNSDDNAYTFDGRVNVRTDNPVYLAIVNERKVDAHASVRPMDVWFLLREPEGNNDEPLAVDWYSEVTVSIDNPEKNNWIRMEMVPRKDMIANGWKAGTGARDYFTTDLVTNTLKDNTSFTIRAPHKDTPDKDSYERSRSRIYFYIDENVTPVNSAGDIPDRTAVINIHYRRYDHEGGTLLDERIRTLEIEQRGLLKVTVTHPSSSTTLQDTYIEQYEEYLEHYDPLDKHNMPGEVYEGMIWGEEGKRYDRYQFKNTTNIPLIGPVTTTETKNFNNFNEVYDNGLQATQWILFEREKDDVNEGEYIPMTTVKIYNSKQPSTAFHYCYGKNKRNEDGSVPSPQGDNYQNISNGGWYLPGIRELERALTQYYVSFDDFRGKFYWSASQAKGSNTSRARATKAIVNGSKVEYAESGSVNDKDNYTNSIGDKGKALRTELFRVRAFYRLPQGWTPVPRE